MRLRVIHAEFEFKFFFPIDDWREIERDVNDVSSGRFEGTDEHVERSAVCMSQDALGWRLRTTCERLGVHVGCHDRHLLPRPFFASSADLFLRHRCAQPLLRFACAVNEEV